MDTSRFRKIRTLDDIKLEKARLKYEMMAAENDLHSSLEGIQRMFTMNGFITRVSTGVLFAQDLYHKFGNIISWFRRKKTTRARDEEEE